MSIYETLIEMLYILLSSLPLSHTDNMHDDDMFQTRDKLSACLNSPQADTVIHAPAQA